jgi:hypothetical protein
LGSALVTLVELVQGPCPKSQLLLSKEAGLTSALDKILVSPFHSRVDAATVVFVKAKALNLIAALLEGREDLVVHRRLGFDLSAASFETCRSMLTAAERGASRCDDLTDEVVEALVFIDNTYVQLSLLPDFARDLSLLLERRKKEHGKDLLDTQVARVEVAWGESRRIENVSFRLPKEAMYLSAGTKARHLSTVELVTAEKRMKLTFEQVCVCDVGVEWRFSYRCYGGCL